MTMADKQVRLGFCDLAPDWDPEDNYFTRVLRQGGYTVTVCRSPEEHPDFVISCGFGRAYLDYGCCRIQFSGEDSWPDLNVFDYSMGFPLLEYGDRYLRLPLYAMRDSWAPALIKHTLPDEDFLARKKFCNFVVSNDFSAERNAFFEALSTRRRVDSGGSYKNNMGGPVADKLAFQKQYKFSIAYENSRDPGYCTEKIVDAFAAGTVPIYWGDPHIKEEFNPESFVCADDYPDNDALIDAIQAIDKDDALYLRYCRAPILTPGCRAERYTDGKACFAFLDAIFAKGPEGAICRNRSCWGGIYENDLRYYRDLAEEAKHPKGLLARLGLRR